MKAEAGLEVLNAHRPIKCLEWLGKVHVVENVIGKNFFVVPSSPDKMPPSPMYFKLYIWKLSLFRKGTTQSCQHQFHWSELSHVVGKRCF